MGRGVLSHKPCEETGARRFGVWGQRACKNMRRHRSRRLKAMPSGIAPLPRSSIRPASVDRRRPPSIAMLSQSSTWC